MHTGFKPGTYEEQVARCQRWSRGRSPSGDQLWLNWVARLRQSGRVIGHFQAAVRPDVPATVGYIVAREHHRQGYAFEGLERVLWFLAGRLGVGEAHASIDPRNQPSIRLVERLGFGLHGESPDARATDGTPDLIYALKLPGHGGRGAC